MVLILLPLLIGYLGSDSWSAMMTTRVQGLSASMYTTPARCTQLLGVRGCIDRAIRYGNMQHVPLLPTSLSVILLVFHVLGLSAGCPRGLVRLCFDSSIPVPVLRVWYLFILSSFYGIGFSFSLRSPATLPPRLHTSASEFMNAAWY